MARRPSTVPALTKRAAEELRQVIDSDARRTEALRALAVTIVDLRQHYLYKDRPDWAGRSAEYRAQLQHVYDAADVPPDSVSNLQASIRYHVGNEVRDRAPVEDLKALGLSPESPLQRAAGRRQPSGTPTVRTADLVADDEDRRAAAFEIVRSVTEHDPDAVVIDLRQPEEPEPGSSGTVPGPSQLDLVQTAARTLKAASARPAPTGKRDQRRLADALAQCTAAVSEIQAELTEAAVR